MGKDYLKPIKLQNLTLISKKQIFLSVKGLVRFIKYSIIIALFYFYFNFILILFPATRPISKYVTNSLINSITPLINNLINYLPNLFAIIIILLITKYVFAAINFIFKALENETIKFSWFYPEWSSTTRKILKTFVILFTMVMIYPYLPGTDSVFFQGLSVFFGVIVSLGSTKFMLNAVSGTILTYTRSFSQDDIVMIAGHLGRVSEKNLLVTRLKTIKNEIISIPNSKVIDNEIINYTRITKEQGSLILHTDITLGYEICQYKVEKLLIQAAKKIPFILEEKEPFVLRKNLNESFITYELNVHTVLTDKIPTIYSDIHKNILDLFNQEGIEVLSPTYHSVRNGNKSTIPFEYQNNKQD